MNESVRTKLTVVFAAREALFSMIWPVNVLSVTPVALLVAWVTTPPRAAPGE
jgi:hypothetical protein